MAEKNKPSVFGGFEALADTLIGNPGSLNDPDENIPEIDPDDLTDDPEEDETEEDELTEDELEELKKKRDKDEEDEEEEEAEESDEDKTDDESEEEGLGEYEPDFVKLLQEEIYKELDWEVEEDESFDSVKDLFDFVKEQVKEASKPQYANDELYKLDEFVRSGGDLIDYFQGVAGGTMNLDNVDLASESTQKAVIREYLSQVRGYKEDRIERTINRHEEGGILEEEAEDALELLKEYKTEQQEKLLEEQKNYSQQVQKQQQKFYSDVEKRVKDLKDIRGINISDREKNDLLDYIFKPRSDGKTKYQEEYASDAVMNLIESAFFTKDRDKNTLVAKAKQSAKSDAYKEIHRKIKASKDKRQKGSGSQDKDDASDILARFGQSLIRKN